MNNRSHYAQSTNRTAEEIPDDGPERRCRLVWVGESLHDDGNFEEAAKALQQCITVKPTYSAAYYGLAQSLQKLERLDECRTVCATGIDVSTKNGDAMVTKNLETLKLSLPS
jgi:Flp pilus assembly protein TadD